MADHTLLLDELLRLPGLRSKTFVLLEPRNAALVCVELTARRFEDWLFARRWVSVRGGRRRLFWLLDEIETQGFRFQVSHGAAVCPPNRDETPWSRASTQWAELTEEERRLHTQLFPQEASLLGDGYDWDDHAVTFQGRPLAADDFGRFLEKRGGIVYEWVKITDEWTWRRYPLYHVAPRSTLAPSPIDMPGSA